MKRVKQNSPNTVLIDQRIIVEIFKNGDPIDMEMVAEKNGELGKFTAQDNIMLQARVIPTLAPQMPGRFICLSADGQHKVTEKKDHSSQDGVSIYRSNIPIKATSNKGGQTVPVDPYASYPSNHIKVIEMFKNGHLKIWEIAVVSENGDFFITTQQTYNTWVFRKDGKVTLPALDRWLSMMTVLNKHIDPAGLQDISEFKPNPEISAQGLNKDEGVIVFYNKAMGFGYVRTVRGDEKVHWTELDLGHRTEFVPGQRVTILEE